MVNKTLGAAWFIRFAQMLPDSARTSHPKTAERLLKNAIAFRVIACWRQKGKTAASRNVYSTSMDGRACLAEFSGGSRLR
jgi:hypothetical protein